MNNRIERNTSTNFFRYFIVIVTAAVAAFAIMRISDAVAGTKADTGNMAAPYSETAVTQFRQDTRTEAEASKEKYTPIAETQIANNTDGSAALSDLVTIPTGKYSTMFRLAGDVEDYYGNRYAKAYLLSGDGLAGYYNKSVTFRNDGSYQWLKGQVALENTDFNEKGMEYGYMKVVLMDNDGNILDSTHEINDKSSKKADVSFFIGNLEEFTIAVDCTDGRGGGGLMTLIANDFIVTK